MNKRTLTLVTLLLWGALMSWFWVSGRIVAYLHPQFHPLVAAAGIVLLLLAPLWWWATRESGAGCSSCGCHHEHGEEPRSRLSAGAAFGFVVLLLPVSTAFFVSPGQFGEAAIMNRTIVTSITQLPSAVPETAVLDEAPVLGDADEVPDVAQWPEAQEEGVEYFTRGPDGAIQLETIDLLFAAEEPALREQFADQRVSVTGQYVPPRGDGSARFDLVRMFMVCCAADARPIGIAVSSPSLPVAARMGWIRVTGKARFANDGESVQPFLEAESIQEVPAPREAVLY